MSRAAVRRRPAGARPERERFFSLGAVVLALGAVLALSAGFPTRPARLSAVSASAGLLPSIDTSARTASVWNCPGPLALTKADASIAIANPGSRQAAAAVLVAETVTAPDGSHARPLPFEQSRVVIPARSELQLPLTAEAVPSSELPPAPPAEKGHKPAAPAADVTAAVSVTVTGAAVAISETDATPAAVVTSPCALGTGRRGYTASGTTLGSSQVELALFDPAAAPAVVNVTVGTSNGLAVPAALQGMVLSPKSLTLVDLAPYVPQAARLAVSATATVGRFVLGSLTSVATSFTTRSLGKSRTYQESGEELAVGVGRAARHWVLPLGPAGPQYSEAIRLFDPTSRAASVSVDAYEAGRSAALEVSVPPGETVSVAAPVLSPAPGAGSRAPATPAGGVLDVKSTNGVGLVVEHETYLTSSRGLVSLLSGAPTAAAAADWVLPGEAQLVHLSGEVTLTDPTARPESVQLLELPAAAPAAPPPPARPLGTFHLAPGSSRLVEAGKLAATSEFALEAIGSGPLLVTENLVPAEASVRPAVAAAVPAS